MRSVAKIYPVVAPNVIRPRRIAGHEPACRLTIRRLSLLVALTGCAPRSEDASPPHRGLGHQIARGLLSRRTARRRGPRPRKPMRLWVPYVVGDLYGAPNAGELAPVALKPDLSFMLDLNKSHESLATALVPTEFSQKWMTIEPAAARIARLSPFVLPDRWHRAGRRERVVRRRHRHASSCSIYIDRPARIRGEIVHEGRNLQLGHRREGSGVRLDLSSRGSSGVLPAWPVPAAGAPAVLARECPNCLASKWYFPRADPSITREREPCNEPYSWQSPVLPRQPPFSPHARRKSPHRRRRSPKRPSLQAPHDHRSGQVPDPAAGRPRSSPPTRPRMCSTARSGSTARTTIDAGIPQRRPRQPLRHARLPAPSTRQHRRHGHGSPRRARHQGRAVGRPPDVGAGRRGEGRQVLPVLPGEGQAGRVPHRRRPWATTPRARSRRSPKPIKNSFSMDPAVFKDDDGKYYMYFGGLWGGQLQNWKSGEYKAERRCAAGGRQARAAAEDRAPRQEHARVRREAEGREDRRRERQAAAVQDHDRRFFEASWVHKYKGNYYFSYSTGDTHFIAYAMGKSPYGPFTYKGRILEPVLGWTNHHSIVEVDGKWYLFYHDTPGVERRNHLRNVKQPIELTTTTTARSRPIDPYPGRSAGGASRARPAPAAAPPRPQPPTEEWGHSSFASKRGRDLRVRPFSSGGPRRMGLSSASS